MKTLSEKLLMVQIAFGTITKKRQNPFHKNQYFDINDLLEQLEPILHEQRILLTQPIKGNRVYSILKCLDSGEELESYLDMPEGITNAQTIGSLCTYFRRYTLSALISLRSEPDDDGNAAANVSNKKQGPKKEGPKTWLTPSQFEKTKQGTVDQIKAVLAKFNGNDFAMKKEYKKQLLTLLESKQSN